MTTYKWLFPVIINILIYFINIKGDWIEIPQVTNKNYRPYTFANIEKYHYPRSKFSTTTSNYEIVMKSSTTSRPIVNVTLTPEQAETIDRRIDDCEDDDCLEFEEIPENGDSQLESNNATNKLDSNKFGFAPFLSNIQQTLISNARKSLKSKISLLKDLRDNLLINIENRMSNLWKTENDKVEARGHDDHEMDFPSNEGALMTIGFLTFAVFLIKMVLKLIYALKYKQQLYGTMTTTATGSGGTTATAYLGRRKRDLDYDESMEILRLIEEYKFGH